MKKAMGLILLWMLLLTAAGCRAEPTETTAHDITKDPIVGFWVVPVGASIPTFYTDFLDPWAFKIYLDIDEAGTAVDLVGGMPFYDMSWGTKEFVNEDGQPVTGLQLSAAIRILMDGTTFGVAFIHRDAAGLLHPGELNGYYFSEPDAAISIPLVQVLADYAIDIELRFETAPQMTSATVSMFMADHTLFGETVLSLSGSGPWTVDAAEPIAYVIIEETYEDGFVQRTLYSRIDGGDTIHTLFLLTQYGYANPVGCTIAWGD